MIVEKDIDVVITWVDNNDPKWQKDFNKYSPTVVDFLRHEDIGTLKYIFRGIEMFMPWVRKIHFVTYGHLPKWLDVNNHKLNIVNHSDIFDAEHLPTFNSTAIEMAFVNIPDLAEKFVYFNDDMILIKSINPERFFKNGLPCDFIALYGITYDDIFSHSLLEMTQIIQKEIPIDLRFKPENLSKFFSRKYPIIKNLKNALYLFANLPLNFSLYHHPQAYLKSNMIAIHERYSPQVEHTLQQRFRSDRDFTDYAYRYYGLAKGKFTPFYPQDTTEIKVTGMSEFKKALAQLKNSSKTNFICFAEDDGFKKEDYPEFKSLLSSYLESTIATPSSFENV